MKKFILLLAIVGGSTIISHAQMGASIAPNPQDFQQQDDQKDNGNATCNEHDWRNPHCGGGCDDSPELPTWILSVLVFGGGGISWGIVCWDLRKRRVKS